MNRQTKRDENMQQARKRIENENVSDGAKQ